MNTSSAEITLSCPFDWDVEVIVGTGGGCTEGLPQMGGYFMIVIFRCYFSGLPVILHHSDEKLDPLAAAPALPSIRLIEVLARHFDRPLRTTSSSSFNLVFRVLDALVF